MLALLTIAHPFVDACSACVAIAGGLTSGRILAYNAIAFATQLPLGMLADSRPRCVRAMTLTGMALAAGAAIAAACGGGGGIALGAACAGNARNISTPTTLPSALTDITASSDGGTI